MALGSDSSRGMWSNRWLFVLAAAGSAVGLGNIWKFPYIAGENGGGAFVLIYLACIFIVGIPVMVSEVMLGREGRASPIITMRRLAESAGRSQKWTFIGWMGVVAGFLILSYYAVIAGWALKYVLITAQGSFTGMGSEAVTATFDAFKQRPWEMVMWQTIFMILTVWIVGRGISQGLETAVRWFMPLLFVLLIALLGYGFTSEGFDAAVDFMLIPNFEAITAEQWLIALGQAFFTLSLGMGAMMAYGSYVPENTSIGSTVVIIALLDTFVAVAAGMAIFPIVFANDLAAGAGPELMFVTLPLAFGNMTVGGVLFGTLFFVLVSFAAITSAISLTEPALSYLTEHYNAKRKRVAISLGVICWVLGLGTVFSFNYIEEVYLIADLNFFGVVEYLAEKIMLPLGGLLIAIFAVWLLPRQILTDQLGIRSNAVMIVWRILGGIIAPLGVLAVFIYTIFG